MQDRFGKRKNKGKKKGHKIVKGNSIREGSALMIVRNKPAMKSKTRQKITKKMNQNIKSISSNLKTL